MLILQEMAYSSPGSFLKGAKFFESSARRRGQFVRHRAELHARVQILGVLPEDHEVDAFLEVERVPRIRLAGPQAHVQIEELPHPHDGRAVDQALALSSGASSASAALAGLEVMAPNMAASTLFSRSIVRCGKASPSCASTPSRCRHRCSRRRSPAGPAPPAPPPDLYPDAVTRQPADLVLRHALVLPPCRT